MRKLMLIPIMMLVLQCVPLVLSAQMSGPADVPRMTIEQLRMQLDNPDFVIIDVRSTKDWENSSIRIKGSVREDGKNFDSWAKKYPKGKIIVLYCK